MAHILQYPVYLVHMMRFLGATGVASVRTFQKVLPYLADPMPVSSRGDSPLATASLPVMVVASLG